MASKVYSRVKVDEGPRRGTMPTMTISRAKVYMAAVAGIAIVETTPVTEVVLNDDTVSLWGTEELVSAKATIEVAGGTQVVAGTGDVASTSEAMNTLRFVPSCHEV